MVVDEDPLPVEVAAPVSTDVQVGLPLTDAAENVSDCARAVVATPRWGDGRMPVTLTTGLMVSHPVGYES